MRIEPNTNTFLELFYENWASFFEIILNFLKQYEKLTFSLLHLMHASAHTHASTLATSLIQIKNSMYHLLMTLIVQDIGVKKKTDRSKTSN